MLIELLAEIKNGGSLEVKRLAQKLDTTSELVTAMIENLQRMGMLDPYNSCENGCSGCALGDVCGKKTSTHTTSIWQYQ